MTKEKNKLIKVSKKSAENLCKPNPWYKEIYYIVFYRILYKIKRIPKEIKWFFQRGKRGWADCDVWGLEHYLTTVIYETLVHLKQNKNGYPATKDPITGKVGFDEGRWVNILNDIIEGFYILKQIGDTIEWVPYEWSKKKRVDFDKRFKNLDTRAITKEEQDKIKKAWKLLEEHFLALWD